MSAVASVANVGAMSAQATSDAIGRVLERVVGAGEMRALTRVTGGATKTTWSFDWAARKASGAGAASGADAGNAHLPLILQQTAPRPPVVGFGKRAPKLSAREDAAVMIAARDAGIPAPRVLHVLAPEDGLGEGYITERVGGETLGKRIVGSDVFGAIRPRLAAQSASILAAIHRLPVQKFPFLATLSAAEELAIYTALLKPYDFVHPAMSYAIRWLGEQLPREDRITVVHSDFRTGNLIVDPAEGIRCVLDWEIARLGDPMHDLGVLCTRSWRFGGSGEAGGFGSRDDLYTAYEQAAGVSVDPRRVRFWEAMSNVKWAIACVRRGLSKSPDGKPANVELAAIGRRLEEPLWDFMALATAKD